MSSVPCSKSICLLTISPCASRRDDNATLLDSQGEKVLAGKFPDHGQAGSRPRARWAGSRFLGDVAGLGSITGECPGASSRGFVRKTSGMPLPVTNQWSGECIGDL